MNGPTLADLFEQHRQGRSIMALKKQAEAAGCAVVALSNWRAWSWPDVERKDIPATDTIKAFAAGLGVTEREVLLAAGRSVGLAIEPDEEVDLIIPGAGLLGAADRAVLASMAGLLAAKKGS